ncbi:MAG: ribosomal-processing cysteine protease Prp [Clostridia bacterium]|nr:ribosomal-processing cysteine protease Prp [Clostridia bacterium]
MIQIYVTEGGGKCRLFAEGHAANGKDREAVCAGVSALIQALILYAGERSVACRLRYQLAPGLAFFSAHGLDEGFALVKKGLSAIAEAYPTYLQINSFVPVDDK